MFDCKKYFLVLILQFLFYACIGQTIIPGGAVSGTWTMAGSPYQVQGSIMIPNDSLLLVEPGVTVTFNGTYKLLVLGRLSAIGTISDTIVFTAADTAVGWRGIRFDNTTSNNDSSILQYCKITHGKANGGPPDNDGGALHFENYSKVRIENCRISFNKANISGGGIYCNNSSPLILNCDIKYNQAISGSGGGIYSTLGGSPRIENNDISYNAGYGGAGISCIVGSAIIYGNEVNYNSSYGSGGAGINAGGTPIISFNNVTYNTNTSEGGGIKCSGNVTVTNNVVAFNQALGFSGISCQSAGGTGFALVSHNIINNNYSTMGPTGPSSTGGGGVNSHGDNIIWSYNYITNNQSNGCGGGIFCNQGSSVFHNNVITNNNAELGGAIYFFLCPNPVFINNTISNNLANQGGAFYCYLTSNPVFNNSIFWGNTASISGDEAFLFDELSDPDFYNCDVEGGTASFETNGGFYLGTYQDNINADPLFAAPSAGAGNTFNGLVADWSLTINSLCIDAGDSTGTYPPTDIAGNPRIINNRIDMGAYEFQGGTWLPEYTPGAQVIIYPNPVSAESVLVSEINLKNASMMVFNSEGRLVASRSGINGTQFAIEKLQLQKGTYFYKLIQSGSNISAGKFMILK